MYLTTKRCVIRKMCVEDAKALYAVLSDSEVMRYIEPVYDFDKTKRFIEKYGMCEAPLVYALAMRDSEEVIGYVIFHPYDENSFEIGWVIGKAHWGRDVADETTKALVQYAKDITEYCVIECDEKQTVSTHIAQKNGFKYEGKKDGLNIYRLKLRQ